MNTTVPPLKLPQPGSAGAARFREFLWQDRGALLTYLLAMVLAVVPLAAIFPLPFLLGKGAWFQQGDAAQNVAGWLAFAQDRWHFPLLRTELVNYPEGISIAFTDSIPLAALLFKPFAAWLPEGFHYFGYWFVVAYLLQALGANFLIRSLGIKSLVGSFCAVAFALIWPAFTMRAGHIALSTHGLLLFALGLYLRGHSGAVMPLVARSWSLALSCICLLVHPYLLAMAYPLFLLALLDQGWRRVTPWRVLVAWFFVSLLLLAILMVAGGYLSIGASAGGYGEYSFNLLGPFCGGYLCPLQDATGSQHFEGFNYFGIGALLVITASLLWHAFRWRRWRMGQEHALICGFLALLTLYAISNKAYLGGASLYALPVPDFLTTITGMFRASGRFFWVVGYSILFIALASLLRRKNSVIALLMGMALIVQWLDTQRFRDLIGNGAAIRESTSATMLDRVAAGARGIHLYPSFGCGDIPPGAYIPYQMYAARHGIAINTAYTARAAGNCARDDGDFGHAPDVGQLYVYLQSPDEKQPFAFPPRVFIQAGLHSECTAWGRHVLCMKGLVGGGAGGFRIRSHEGPVTWKASELPTLAGQRANGSLSAGKGRAGILSFGPYVDLPAGSYRVGITYAGNAPPPDEVGRWEIGTYVHGDEEITSGILQGTHARKEVLQREFHLDKDSRQVEIRIHSAGSAEVSLDSIRLERLSDVP